MIIGRQNGDPSNNGPKSIRHNKRKIQSFTVTANKTVIVEGAPS